jgi:hypothetical protein
MPQHSALRDRMPSETISGGMSRIRMGAFGIGDPSTAFETVGQFDSDGLYNYHEGDLFTPGAGNWVFEPNFELPLITIWGRAFLSKPNTWPVLQPPQVWAQPTVQNNGIGGLQAGDLQLQPLLYEGEGGG